jgi:hypothetical protein
MNQKSLNKLLLSKAKFTIEHTGGNCLALKYELNKYQHMLITNSNGLGIPKYFYDEILIGFYDYLNDKTYDYKDEYWEGLTFSEFLEMW